MKQLRGWIGRKRRRDKQQKLASSKQGKNGISHRKNRGSDKAVQENGSLSSEAGSPTMQFPVDGETRKSSSIIATGVQQPGQKWLNFKLNREQVIAQLFAF